MSADAPQSLSPRRRPGATTGHETSSQDETHTAEGHTRERASTLDAANRRTHRRGVHASHDLQAALPHRPNRRYTEEDLYITIEERPASQRVSQGLDEVDRRSEVLQPRPSQRRSMGFYTSTYTPPSRMEAVLEDRTSRRRSAAPFIHPYSGSFFQPDPSSSNIPASPPPSYQRGNYGGTVESVTRPEPHPGRQISMDSFASAFYLKPRWQSDDEVAECPICRRPFTFFYRKHHCRKCGRVVCANCSPHRITIPKQYIVEPPGEGSEGEQEEALRAGGDSEANSVFGGQEVRLCNPCVPDPNPLPPPRYSSLTQAFPDGSHPQVHSQHLRRSNSHRDWVGPYGAMGDATLSRQRSATESFARAPYSPTGLRTSRRYPSGIQLPEPPTSAAAPLPPDRQQRDRRRQTYHGHRHRSAASTSVLPQQQPPPPHGEFYENPRDAPLPPIPVRTPPRQIAEEDECPVCHEELPPKGPNGDETAREEHISLCIVENSALGAGSTPISTPDPSLLSQQQEQQEQQQQSAGPGASSSAPSGGWHHAHNSLLPSIGAGGDDAVALSPSNGGNSGSVNTGRPRADTNPFTGVAGASGRRQSYHQQQRRANMLVYHATEKDCLDAEGRPRECVICLEEFIEGAELGRLECWCAFHRPCIRGWWDQKGRGACPTHQRGL